MTVRLCFVSGITLDGALCVSTAVPCISSVSS